MSSSLQLVVSIPNIPTFNFHCFFVAYDVLSDDDKRKQYDKYGANGPNQQGGWHGDPFGGGEHPFGGFYDSFFSKSGDGGGPHGHGGFPHFNFDDFFKDSDPFEDG